MIPARTSSWKRENTRNKKSKLIRLIFLIVTLFVVLNLATKVPGAVRFFTQPFDVLPGTDKDTSILDFSYRSNFALLSYLSDDILFDAALVSYEPKDQKITFVHLDLKENDSLRKKVNSLFREGGVGKVQKYLSLGFFVPVDRYLAIEKADFSKEYIQEVKRKLEIPSVFSTAFSADEIFGNDLRTNMSSKEYLDLILKIRSSSYNQTSYFRVEAEDLPDSSTATILENQFLDSKVLDEGAAVAVQNSSGEVGLVGTLSEYLTNLGANVVVVESNKQIVEESSIIRKQNKDAVTGRIQTLFDADKKGNDGVDFPGDILVVIGKDAVEGLTLR